MAWWCEDKLRGQAARVVTDSELHGVGGAVQPNKGVARCSGTMATHRYLVCEAVIQLKVALRAGCERVVAAGGGVRRAVRGDAGQNTHAGSSNSTDDACYKHGKGQGGAAWRARVGMSALTSRNDVLRLRRRGATHLRNSRTGHI